MTTNDQATLLRRGTYVALSLTFIAGFAGFNLIQRGTHRKLELKPYELAMLGFSVYRLGRLVAYDTVMESFRSFFARTVPDPSGAGETVEPKKQSGVQEALGELVSCPICTGTWIAAGLVYGLALAPGPMRVLIYIMSAMGISELLNA